MKRIFLTLTLLMGAASLSIFHFQLSTFNFQFSIINAQCPLFQLKPLLESQCPTYTTDTTSLHARTTTPDGYEFGMNYRALRLDAPRQQVPEALLRRLFDEFLSTMRLATSANHYESHRGEQGDTISFTLTHGDLRGLLASIDKQVYSRDTMWSASLTITTDRVRFLTLSTWNAHVLSIPLPKEFIDQLKATEPKKETSVPTPKP